jgi:hypothetical protein
VIAGAMPKFQRWVHFAACGFMCLLFAGLGVLAGVVCVAGLRGVGPSPVAYVLFGVPFAALAVWAIVSQVRRLKTLVREFSYDGRLLRFRTIMSSQEQVRGLQAIAEIREGRSRAQSIGYYLGFRDGQRVYLDYWLENVAVLAEQLRFDLRQQQGVSAEPSAAPDRGRV